MRRARQRLGPVLLAGVRDYLPALILLAAPAGLVLLGLAWLARRFPLPAVVTALVVYLLWSACGFLVNAPLAERWLSRSALTGSRQRARTSRGLLP